MTARPLNTVVESLLRELAPQILGAVVRRAGDFDKAEDAVQEALIDAAEQWPANGIPENSRGWLYRVAIRRLHDQLRSDSARHEREQTVAVDTNEFVVDVPMDAEQDDTLRLLFMCCHPALSPSSAVALTLRAVGGLTTAEIAHAFLVPESTMAQRISRAKQAIKSSGIAFHMPAVAERVDAMRSVLHVLYLMFNEGYSSSHGAELQRTDLAAEAIRITRLARTMLPIDAELTGLLALMLLTHSRRGARTTTDGAIIPLDEQNRSLWDRSLIDEGQRLIASALSRGNVGPYQLQAAIASLHCEAQTTEATDWPQILALYSLLLSMTGNPMVALNHAIAVAMVHGAARGMTLLDALDVPNVLAGHYRLDSVRAHFCEMAGDNSSAAVHFRRAAEKTLSVPERNYLIHKAAVASSRNRTVSC